MAASLCLFILVKMAASLASIAETWPETMLTSIVSRKLLTQKIQIVHIVIHLEPDGFSARSAIFCRYWTCSFSGRNNQAIEAEVVCHFHLLVLIVVSRFCFRSDRKVRCKDKQYFDNLVLFFGKIPIFGYKICPRQRMAWTYCIIDES